MSDISSIGSLATPSTLREFAQQSSPKTGGNQDAVGDDQVEISELATFLSRLAELPDARARKIVDIRNAIHQDRYELGDKLDIATDRLFEDLQRI